MGIEKGVFPRIDLLEKLKVDRGVLLEIGDVEELAIVNEKIAALKEEIREGKKHEPAAYCTDQQGTCEPGEKCDCVQ